MRLSHSIPFATALPLPCRAPGVNITTCLATGAVRLRLSRLGVTSYCCLPLTSALFKYFGKLGRDVSQYFVLPDAALLHGSADERGPFVDIVPGFSVDVISDLLCRTVDFLADALLCTGVSDPSVFDCEAGYKFHHTSAALLSPTAPVQRYYLHSDKQHSNVRTQLTLRASQEGLVKPLQLSAHHHCCEDFHQPDAKIPSDLCYTCAGCVTLAKTMSSARARQRGCGAAIPVKRTLLLSPTGIVTAPREDSAAPVATGSASVASGRPQKQRFLPAVSDRTLTAADLDTLSREELQARLVIEEEKNRLLSTSAATRNSALQAPKMPSILQVLMSVLFVVLRCLCAVSIWVYVVKMFNKLECNRCAVVYSRCGDSTQIFSPSGRRVMGCPAPKAPEL